MEEELTRDIGLAITVIVVALAAFVVLLAYLFTTRKNKLLQEKKLMKTQFEQELLQTQLEIQEQTLKTISEEIHDNVGQVLSLAKLNLNTFETNTEKKLQDTKNLVSKAINDLRDLSRSLHGDRIAEIDLEDAITNELKILQNTGQFETGFSSVGQRYELDTQSKIVLYRIVQEALHNSVKHAKAKNINVQLNYEPALFSLLITDDGNGFDPETIPSSKKGIGLKSMQNRAVLIGGEFSIRSSANNGTGICVKIPNNHKI
ncbi:MAG TPA: sensor histidine kinase [Ferruginibacter sp.]|nr:sensor histidine kinase [Ferruginibacter sp.]